MSRIEEIDKIVDEIGDADSLYEFAECVYEDRQRIAELEEQLEEKDKDFKFYQKLYKIEKEQNDNYRTEKYELNVKELRKLDLSFPEKEWYYKGFDNCERQASSTRAELTIEIKDLKKQLEEKEKEIEKLQKDYEFKDKDCAINLERFCDDLTKNVQLEFLIKDLQNELKSQPAEIVEKIKGRFLATCQIEQGNDEMIASFQTFNRCLDTILKEYQK